MSDFDLAARLSLFLTEHTGSPSGHHATKLCKNDQLSLIGRYMGRGLLVFDGKTETIRHQIKTCFGTDYDITSEIKFDGTIVFNNRN